MVRDYTLEGVQRQLRAMACPLYDVTVIRKAAGTFFKTDKNADWVLGKVAYWKHLNAVPSDPAAIHIRPAKSLNRALIFVDDVSKQGIERLREERLEPACIVETHEGCFQLWVDFGEQPMPPRDRGILSKYLQVRAGGDAGGVASLHSGRLCGFTNCKEQYRGLGGPNRFPYVKCSLDSRPLVCSKAQQARAWASTPAAEAWVAAHQDEHERRAKPEKIQQPTATNPCGGDDTVSQKYLEVAWEKALSWITEAVKGDRNRQLYRASFAIGTLAHIYHEAGRSDDSLKEQLVRAAMDAYGNDEWTQTEAESTVRSGFKQGQASGYFSAKHLRLR